MIHANKIPYYVKVFAEESDNLTLTNRIHLVKVENQFHPCTLSTSYILAPFHTSLNTHAHTYK